MNSDIAKNVLTHKDAQKRAETIYNASYKLSIDLHSGKETYQGKITINFETSTNNNVIVDFTGSEITTLIINETLLESPDWDGHKLNLPQSLIQKNNTVEITYTNQSPALDTFLELFFEDLALFGEPLRGQLASIF